MNYIIRNTAIVNEGTITNGDVLIKNERIERIGNSIETKYEIAANTSLANFSFYMGTSNDNIDEVLKTNKKKNDVCGVKIFMGSSTGNLLVDNALVLDRIFAESEILIAT